MLPVSEPEIFEFAVEQVNVRLFNTYTHRRERALGMSISYACAVHSCVAGGRLKSGRG